MTEFKHLNEDLYYCYSPRQLGFLKSNNFYFIFSERHDGTGKKYWAFEMTDELSRALKEYSKLKRESH